MGTVSHSGLSSFSFGILVSMYALIKRIGNSMMEPGAMPRYGYFYNGFGVYFSWWELLVKCMKVFSMYLVDHVLIFQEVQSKLVLFTGFGAVFRSLHGTYKPHDTRA